MSQIFRLQFFTVLERVNGRVIFKRISRKSRVDRNSATLMQDKLDRLLLCVFGNALLGLYKYTFDV